MYRTRLLMVREPVPDIDPVEFNSPVVVADQFRHLRDASQEEFHVVALSAQHRVIGSYMASRGSLSATIVHPREVFKYAITMNAAAIIVVHNHPSGGVEPSKEDKKITTKIKDAGILLGIPMLDHIIIGDDSWSSWNSGTWDD